MNKENSLYTIIGLLAGLIIGYVGTNYINGTAPTPRASGGAATGALPPDHPPTSATSGAADGSSNNSGGGPQGDVMAVIQQARNDPSNFDAQMKAADQFLQINRKEGALEFYERAAKIKPDDFDLLVKLGNTYYDLQRFGEAARWYEQALKIKADPMVQNDLGLTYYLRSPRDLDQAIANFRAALKSNPRHEQALQNLTLALIEKGEKAEAAASLKQLEQVNPKNPAIADLRSRL